MVEVDPATARRTNQILWTTLLLSQLVYAGIALSGIIEVVSTPPGPEILYALSAVALGLGVGSHYLWRRATGAGQTLHAATPAPSVAFGSYIVAWVLDEGIAILGLILALLAYSLSIWAPFSTAAFVLMLLHRPK